MSDKSEQSQGNKSDRTVASAGNASGAKSDETLKDVAGGAASDDQMDGIAGGVVAVTNNSRSSGG